MMKTLPTLAYTSPLPASRVSPGNPKAYPKLPVRAVTPTFGCDKTKQAKWIDNDIYLGIRRMPKVDLHEHQSGSSDLALLKTALIQKGQRTDLDWEALREEYRVTFDVDYGKETVPQTQIRDDGSLRSPTSVRDLGAYRRISEKINPLVKNPHSAYLAAHLFALEASSENVRYAEYRLHPEKQSAPAEEILHLVEDGFQDAILRLERSRKKLDYGLIILAERHGDESVNPETGRKQKVDKAVLLAEKAIEWRKKGHNIVGFDLAGDELNCPVTDFKPAFDRIHAYNQSVPPEERIGITIHAGETQKSGNLQGWESVQKAVEVGWSPNTPMRIGHGVQLINSADILRDAFHAFLTDPHWENRYPKQTLLANAPLLKMLVDKGICLEMCPKSNIQTGAIAGLNLFSQDRTKAQNVSWYKQHPAIFLSKLGVKVAISSDNRTISNSDNTNDFVKLYKYGGATYEDRKQMVLNGLESAFIFDTEKRKTIMEDVHATFQALEREPALAMARYKEKHNLQSLHAFTRLRLALSCELSEILYFCQQFIKQAGQWLKDCFRNLGQRFSRVPQSDAPPPEGPHKPVSA